MLSQSWGYIGLNAGLITLTENEAQLAGVVAHELAHVVLRHSAEMMANSNVNSIPCGLEFSLAC